MNLKMWQRVKTFWNSLNVQVAFWLFITFGSPLAILIFCQLILGPPRPYPKDLQLSHQSIKEKKNCIETEDGDIVCLSRKDFKKMKKQFAKKSANRYYRPVYVPVIPR